MAKKKRYTLEEVNKLFMLKYPKGCGNGAKEITKMSSISWGDKYRIGYDYHFKSLIEVVDKLKLED